MNAEINIEFYGFGLSGCVIKRIIKYGVFCSASLAAYYHNDIRDLSVATLRFGRTTIAVGEIVFDYNRTLYRGNVDPSSKEYNEIKSAVHLRSAKKLLKLCEDNGGAFIKVGQHVGALDYLLPIEYVKTMRVLHNHAPQTKFEDVLSVMREDFGCEPSAIFESIDQVPIGAASLAQVHKAKLIDGPIVAVKVQHPLVKSHAQVDLKTMEVLFKAVMWYFPEFKLMWLLEETKHNLPCELNFIMEGQNSEKTAKLLSHLPWLHVPKIFWKQSTSRVLTMEYCEGMDVGELSQLTDPKLTTKKREISQKITQLYSEMIFLHGYVHCDPHPGNLRIELDSKGKIVVHLLDHGLYSQLPEDFRDNYSKFWMSVMRSNVNDIKADAEKLGVGELYGLFACMASGRSWNAILDGIDKNRKTKEEEEEIKSDASKYMVEITEVLHRVPRQMLLIFKTNDLLRGLDYMLGVRDNTAMFVTMSRSCAAANYQREYAKSKNLASKFRATLFMYVAHIRISLYEMYLWWTSRSIAQ
nr:EOG090X047B [Sida crystallina]